MNNDFGSAFRDPDPIPRLGSQAQEPPLRLTLEEIETAENKHLAQTISRDTLQNIDPREQIKNRYGLILEKPGKGEQWFFGTVHNRNERSVEKEVWDIFSTTPRVRRVQILNFVVEVTDASGDTIDQIPIEVRGMEISGYLPENGHPVAVCGARNAKDQVVHTYKVINLHTRSSLSVVPEKDCFIATAVYGSIDSPQVQQLRAFRDYKLMQTWLGRKIVRMYYRYSPTIAERLSFGSRRANAVRMALELFIFAFCQMHGCPDRNYQEGELGND